MPFRVEDDGTVRTTEELDREVKASYTFTLYARDHGQPINIAHTRIVLTVSDINDHHPEFDQSEYRVNILEKSPVDSVILLVRATDKDEGPNANVTYGLHGNGSSYFSVGITSGLVTITQQIDKSELIKKGLIHEGNGSSASTLFMTLKASDQGQPIMNGSAQLSIKIDEINDDTPKFDNTTFSVVIPEEVEKGKG